MIGGAVFSMASHGADQLMVQRYLCAKSLAQARLALVLSGFVILVQFLLFLGVGVGMYLLCAGRAVPAGRTGARNDEVFGLFIVTKLPTGVVGVLVAAVLAAAMSTLSSSLNSSANARRHRLLPPAAAGPLRERGTCSLSRVMTAVWGVAQMGGGATPRTSSAANKSVVEQVLAVAGFTTGLVLGLFILGQPAAAGAVVGGARPGWCAGSWRCWRCGCRRSSGTPILAWPWFAPVGAGTTVVVALLVTVVGTPVA